MKRLLFIAVICFVTQSLLHAREKTDTIKTALLIVDIQNFYFPGEGPGLVNAEATSLIAKEVLEVFREEKQLVVHVQHLSKKSIDIKIHENVLPVAGEKVVTKEKVNSFQDTELLEYLNENNITRLVIIGMQTQMCVEAATRAASDFGFECIVVEDACTTKDLKYKEKLIKAEDVHNSTLVTLRSGGYAKITDLEGFKENLVMYLFKAID